MNPALETLAEKSLALAQQLARDHPAGVPLDRSSATYLQLEANLKSMQSTLDTLRDEAIQKFHADMAGMGLSPADIAAEEAKARAAATAATAAATKVAPDVVAAATAAETGTVSGAGKAPDVGSAELAEPLALSFERQHALDPKECEDLIASLLALGKAH